MWELAVRPERLPTPRKRTPKQKNRPGVKEPLSELRTRSTPNQMQRQKRVLHAGQCRGNFEAAKSVEDAPLAVDIILAEERPEEVLQEFLRFFHD
jgi:hypothetical protein